MNKKSRLLLILLPVVFFVGLCFSTYTVKGNSDRDVDLEIQLQIKQAINNYFEARYSSFTNLQLGDFSALIMQPSTNSKMQKELDKLDLEIYHASVFQLRYQSYQYYLDFGNPEIDPATNSATVDVIEGSDVVYEISAPLVSKMRNQKHTINLQNENGVWKITSDSYEDFFWQVLKVKKVSHDDFRKGIFEAGSHWKMQLTNPQQNTEMDTQVVIPSTHIVSYYNRIGAVAYASLYYQHYNLEYTKYPQDCTNFVSQAMYEGGGLPMTGKTDIYGNTSGLGGWYWYSNYDRASGWTGVDQLNEYLVQNFANYAVGPVAVEVEEAVDLQPGDIIQYDWENDPIDDKYKYNHSVMVVTQSTGIALVAGHNPDVILDPYTKYIIIHDKPNYPAVARYLHIITPEIYLPVILNPAEAWMGSPNPATEQNAIDIFPPNTDNPETTQEITDQQSQSYP